MPLPDSPAIDARNADGYVWRRAWALHDRLVLDFVGIAALEATDDGVVVLDRELPRDLEQHLVFDHAFPLMLARRGALVLHGGLLVAGDRAVVLVGPSGVGKSTLAAHAWQRGWTLGGDDGTVLEPGDSRVLASPTYSTLRLTEEAAAMLGIPTDEGSQAVGKRRLRTVGSDRPLQQAPAELALVVALEPAPADAEVRLTHLTGVDAHLALFGCTFYADLARGRLLRGILDRLAEVVDIVSIARLAVPRGTTGLDAAERLLRREVDA